MPQEFQILRCYSCETFNVDIVKKTITKWQCKMCGEKQSIKHVYGTSSSAKDCREMAQALNEKRGEKADEIPNFDENFDDDTSFLQDSKIIKTGSVSRWAKFLVKPPENAHHKTNNDSY